MFLWLKKLFHKNCTKNNNDNAALTNNTAQNSVVDENKQNKNSVKVVSCQIKLIDN